MKLSIDIWPVLRFKVFHDFCTILVLVIEPLRYCIVVFTQYNFTRSFNSDLSISVSSLGASYQLFTYICNRWRWRLYRSFLDPNNFWRRVDQHALLQFINILRNPGIRFLFSGVLTDAHLIENLPWKASSQPSTIGEEHASLTCSLTVSSSKNVATFRSISRVIPFAFNHYFSPQLHT